MLIILVSLYKSHFCIRSMVFFIQMDHLDRMGHRNPAAVDGPSGAGFTPREGSVPYGERCELVMG